MTANEQKAEFDQQRQDMVRVQIEGRGIRDPDVLRAMRSVPRHRFVPAELQDRAYSDGPLPIGHGQTISQPYIVALMTEQAGLKRESRVLDVGTGCGYQAAVLAEICDAVESIEIVESLAASAAERLASLGYDNIQVRHANARTADVRNANVSNTSVPNPGSARPLYDAIIVAAAPDAVPPSLIELLAPGGRMVIPVGAVRQTLKVISRSLQGGIEEETICPVSFVPMTGMDGSDT